VALKKGGEDQLNLLSNGEVLHGVKEDRMALRKTNRKKVKSIGHILRRKFLLKRVVEGKVEERTELTERERRRRKQLFDDLKEKQNTEY